jgi:hypothetical protein
MLPFAFIIAATFAADAAPASALASQFESIKGQHVKLVHHMDGGGIGDMTVDKVGSDGFCGQTYDHTGKTPEGFEQCITFASITALQMSKPNYHRVYFVNGVAPE